MRLHSLDLTALATPGRVDESVQTALASGWKAIPVCSTMLRKRSISARASAGVKPLEWAGAPKVREVKFCNGRTLFLLEHEQIDWHIYKVGVSYIVKRKGGVFGLDYRTVIKIMEPKTRNGRKAVRKESITRYGFAFSAQESLQVLDGSATKAHQEELVSHQQETASKY